MSSEWSSGVLPPTDDNGNYKDVAMRVGYWVLYSDGTAKNLATGTTFDPDKIGASGGSALGFASDGIAVDHSSEYPRTPRQFEASSPLSLSPRMDAPNPVLTASDVTDVSGVNGVADPFIVYENGKYHMFFEVLADTLDIAHATSEDGYNWTYNQVVLADTDHAFPQVLKHNGTWYMAPNQGGGHAPENEYRVYKADPWPTGWTLVATPVKYSNNIDDPALIHLPDRTGEPWDSSPLQWDGSWYFTVRDESTTELRLFVGDSLTSGWSEHPASPITDSSIHNAPAGRPVVLEDSVIQPTRKIGFNSEYDELNAIRYTELTPDTVSFKNEPSLPIAAGTQSELASVDANNAADINSQGMHHLDFVTEGAVPTGSIAVLDQKASGTDNWTIAVYDFGSNDEPTHAFQTSSQSVSNASATKVSLTTKGWDLHGRIDTSNNEITVPHGGWYRLAGKLEYQAPAGGAAPFHSWLRAKRVSDGTNLNLGRAHVSVDQPWTVYLEPQLVRLSGGDGVYFETYQNSGGSVSTAGTLSGSYFELSRVR